MPENTTAEKKAKKAALETFRNAQIINAELTVKQYESWETEFNKATEAINNSLARSA